MEDYNKIGIWSLSNELIVKCMSYLDAKDWFVCYGSHRIFYIQYDKMRSSKSLELIRNNKMGTYNWLLYPNSHIYKLIRNSKKEIYEWDVCVNNLERLFNKNINTDVDIIKNGIGP